MSIGGKIENATTALLEGMPKVQGRYANESRHVRRVQRVPAMRSHGRYRESRQSVLVYKCHQAQEESGLADTGFFNIQL